MGVLTDEMKRIIVEQSLGFVATVCPDGTPNLSPKGTTTLFDDDHLIFADVCSPGTVANLRQNPIVEVNVVDPFVRKGCRAKGRATVYDRGPRFDELVAFYRKRGSTSVIRSVVLIEVESAAMLISPAYDTGLTEAEVRARWEAHHEELRKKNC